MGVSIMFPLDLVKTRLQNQSVGPKGEKQYKNMLVPNQYVDVYVFIKRHILLVLFIT